MTLNYDTESKQLGEQKFFKPVEGQYQIIFKSEMTDLKTRTIKVRGSEEIIQESTVQIKVNGMPDEMTWSINKAKSDSSLWGQVLRFAKLSGGALEGKTCTLIVKAGKDKSGNSKRDYTILDLLQQTKVSA